MNRVPKWGMGAYKGTMSIIWVKIEHFKGTGHDKQIPKWVWAVTRDWAFIRGFTVVVFQV